MANFPSRCQHIKVNGTLCGSPALRRSRFCYFHKLHHEERIELNTDRARRRRNVTLDLPVLEDADSIQVSLMQIMRLIVAGQIDPKTAGLLLYALQTASANLPRLRLEPCLHDVILDVKAVDETPLRAHVWENSDFLTEEDEEEDEVARTEAVEAAARKAKRKAELESEAEADRIIEEGRREYEAHRKALARQLASRPPGLPRDPLPAVTPAGRAVIPPAQTAQPPGKRPPANANMDDVRKKVNDQIMKALPAIAAAQSRRENGNSSG
jgi:hypothetical protein